MPTKTPQMSYTLLRNYTERFTWRDRVDGTERTGFNPPPEAVGTERAPFFIRYITKDGKVEEGRAVCIGVDTRRQQRRIKFTASGEIRMVRDYLVIEVDGTIFLTH